MSSHPRDPNLQDSFGPEIATSDAPQTIVESGLPEAVAPGLYAQQAEKHNNHANYSNHEISTTPVGGYRKRKVLGLPFLCFWGLAGALILLIGLGVGLGVGLGLNSRAASSTSSAATTTTSSAVGDSATTAATSSSLAGTTTAASSTTATTTTAAATATATGASVAICQNAYLDYCTTIDVPASSCSEFSFFTPRRSLFVCWLVGFALVGRCHRTVGIPAFC